MTLDDVVVRAESDGAVLGPFDVARLARDIGAGALSRLPRSELRELVAKVEEGLEERLSTIVHTLPGSGARAGNRTYRHAIFDSAVRDEVESQLRSTGNSPVRVLYALATRGRTDVWSRPGFQTAEDFLHWCFAEPDFRRLRVRLPERISTSPREQWIQPKRVWIPGMLIKRDGTAVEFEIDRFRTGIKRALYGRRGPSLNPDWVASWVLHQLAGQHAVTSAQLSAGVMTGLRRLDEIAYLRWVGIAKRYGSASAFVDEAMGLIRYPSQPLLLSASRQ